MSLQDNLFIEDAEEDLKAFLKIESRKRVLLFPPVNNYKRFLIHQLVQDCYGDSLQTFSIGQGLERRTVVCFKSDLIRLPSQTNGFSSSVGGRINQRSSRIMGIESQCTPTASPERGQKLRQIKSVPAVEIYRPPAARRARLEKSPTGSQITEHGSDASSKANRQKRPDRAVYVPRHRRGAPDPDSVTLQEVETKRPKEILHDNVKPAIDVDAGRSIISKELPVDQCTIESIEAQSTARHGSMAPKVENLESQIANQALPIADQPVSGAMSDELSSKEVPEIDEITEEKMEEEVKSDDDVKELPSSSEQPEEINDEAKLSSSLICLESDERDRRKNNELVVEGDRNCANQTVPLPAVTEVCNLDLVYNDKSLPRQELESLPSNIQESSEEDLCKEINKNVFNQFIIPEVLIISSSKDQAEMKCTNPLTAVAPTTLAEKKIKKVERAKSKPAPPPLPVSKINRDECDWDSLFDDNGDCLDPTLMDELTSAVGEVVIEKPKVSCKAYNRSLEVSSDELGHVLEIYNFPSDFKSSDLVAVFSPFKSEGFELKWVDDTHCLGVFSSPLIAAEVLASDHPFVKTRPLSEATALSKTKAKRTSEFLQPYRNRPETCAALARRLVTKSLGVKLATARQEREQEKIVLREAKEKKRLANKQREDAWEGIISENQST